MEIKRFGSNGRMSRVVQYGQTLFLSGLTSGEGTVEEQTADVLELAEGILSGVNSDKEHILSATIYLADMSLFAGMNSVWDKWVSKGNEPARATVEAKLANKNILVEISFVAAVKG